MNRMNPSLLVVTVRRHCELGNYMPSDTFAKLVDGGVPTETMSDALQEDLAMRAHEFEPGADCFRYTCGCRVAFRTPYAYRSGGKPGAYYEVGPNCRTRDGDSMSETRLADLYCLMVGINAIKYARAKPPNAHRHAVLATAGLPFDPDIILAEFVFPTKMRERYTAGQQACSMYAARELAGIGRGGPAGLRLDTVTECTPDLFPYFFLGHYDDASYKAILADYKNHLEVRG